jgi:hypothetical protein
MGQERMLTSVLEAVGRASGAPSVPTSVRLTLYSSPLTHVRGGDSDAHGIVRLTTEQSCARAPRPASRPAACSPARAATVQCRGAHRHAHQRTGA